MNQTKTNNQLSPPTAKVICGNKTHVKANIIHF